jgi:hypothetical protein
MGPWLLRGPRGWMGRSVDATTPTDRGGSSRQHAVGTHTRNPKRRTSHPRTRVSHVGPEGADWPCLHRSGPGAQAARHEGRALSVGDDSITPAPAGSRYALSVRIGPSWYVTLASALVLSACSGIPAALSMSTSPPAPTSTGTPSALARPTATTPSPTATLAALPQIIDWYATHGYRFVDLTGRSTGA